MHCSRKLKLVDLGRNFLDYLEEAQTFVIELSTRMMSDDVLCIESDLVFYLESRSRGAATIGFFLLMQLCAMHLLPDVIHDVSKCLSHVHRRWA